MIVTRAQIYRCDICGKESTWNSNWTAHYFPFDIRGDMEFHLCSEYCDRVLLSFTKTQRKKRRKPMKNPKHDKPMSETTSLNAFPVEMLEDLKTCLSACEHYKLPLKNIPKWLSIINAALKDARFEEETKGQRLPFK